MSLNKRFICFGDDFTVVSGKRADFDEAAVDRDTRGRFANKGAGEGGAGEKKEPGAKQGRFARLTGAFHTIAHALREAPAAIGHAAVEAVKDKIHEYKSAGIGVKSFLTGKPVTKEQKTAIKKVALSLAVTIIAGHLTPLLHIGSLIPGEAAAKAVEKIADKSLDYVLDKLAGKGLKLDGLNVILDAAWSGTEDDAMDWLGQAVAEGVADALEAFAKDPPDDDDETAPRKDEAEHAPAGSPIGGQFVGKGEGGSPSESPSEKRERVLGEIRTRGASLFGPKELSLPKDIAQPIHSRAELFAKAKDSQEQMVNLMNHGEGLDKALGAKVVRADLGKKPDLSGKGPVIVIGPPKDEARAAEKVKADYTDKDGKEHWERLGDVVRSSIAVDSPAEIPGVVEKLKASGFEIARAPKDRFSNPTSAGYRDALLNVKLPNGIVGEVQLQVKGMLAAKSAGHKLYETIRTIEGAAKTRAAASSDGQMHFTPAEKATYDDAISKSRALYDDAWKKAGGRADAGDWNEEDHPREKGKFAAKGGGGSEGQSTKAGSAFAGMIEKKGGFSYRPGAGGERVPKTGYMVSLPPSAGFNRVVDMQQLAATGLKGAELRAHIGSEVDAWMRKTGPAIEGKANHYLGGWLQREKGTDKPLAIHLDVSERFPDHDKHREKAIQSGRDRNQISIWDIDKSEEIPTGGTGHGDGGDFDEAKHPRKENGQFGEGGGSESDTPKAGSERLTNLTYKAQQSPGGVKFEKVADVHARRESANAAEALAGVNAACEKDPGLKKWLSDPENQPVIRIAETVEDAPEGVEGEWAPGNGGYSTDPEFDTHDHLTIATHIQGPLGELAVDDFDPVLNVGGKTWSVASTSRSDHEKVASSALHEFGHHVALAQGNAKLREQAAQIANVVSSSYDKITNKARAEARRGVPQSAWKTEPLDEIAGGRAPTPTVSRYAMTNSHEYFAECFATQMQFGPTLLRVKDPIGAKMVEDVLKIRGIH